MCKNKKPLISGYGTKVIEFFVGNARIHRVFWENSKEIVPRIEIKAASILKGKALKEIGLKDYLNKQMDLSRFNEEQKNKITGKDGLISDSDFSGGILEIIKQDPDADLIFEPSKDQTLSISVESGKYEGYVYLFTFSTEGVKGQFNNKGSIVDDQKYLVYYKNKNGDVYKGEFKNGKRHGQGIKKYKNGDKYAGEFKNDKKHGNGEFIFVVEGDKYVGEFKDGIRCGYGEYTFAGWKYL